MGKRGESGGLVFSTYCVWVWGSDVIKLFFFF